MSARERILDAAATVMTERGIARATTKEIARVAGCSEALLYKHFADKQEIFLGVLAERLPQISAPDQLVGAASVRENLQILTRQLLAFYLESFPIAASIFSETDLLTAWRSGLRERGAGPHVPVTMVEDYIVGEQRAGRVPSDVDAWAVAALLAGAALQQAFFATFEGGRGDVDVGAVATRLVASVLGPPDR